MNAEPLLIHVANALAKHRLEAVMVGNAAAALHGAPVTTLDIDFMFRKTPANLNKLKAVARSLGAVILKPYYPVSDLFRVVNDERRIQLDFMSKLDGIRSFESLKSRATTVLFGERELTIACLADIIKRKRAAGGDRDRAVLKTLQKTLDEQKNAKTSPPPRTALKKESERALVDQIRRLQALPMNKRTHFLRVRHPSGGSHL